MPVSAPLEDKIEPHSVSAPTVTPESSSTHSSDLDDNYAIYRRHADQEVDPAEAKKVLRKIDFRIVPYVPSLLAYIY
jgi:hypothetical protein